MPLVQCGYDLCDTVCTSLDSDPSNCGACAHVCPEVDNATAVCSQGHCAGVCRPSYADCNGDLASSGGDGCEVNTITDVLHCGACGSACPALANAAVACVGGTCGLAQCNPGFANCDGDIATGCEVELATSAAHCGACNNPCSLGQVCQSSVCGDSTFGGVGESCANAISLAPGLNAAAWIAAQNHYLTTAQACYGGAQPSGPDVVLRYVPAISGYAEISFEKPAGQRWGAVVSGAPCGALTPQLACISALSPPSMGGIFPVTAGTPYYVYTVGTTHGPGPLANPLNITVNEIDCARSSSVAAISPAHDSTATGPSPVLRLTTVRPMNRFVGSIDITGSQGTSATLTIPSEQVVFSADNHTATLLTGVTFVPGELVTVSLTALYDSLCNAPIEQPDWIFRIPTPTCTPGASGMIGTTEVRSGTDISPFIFSEPPTHLTVGQDPAGWVYIGTLHRLFRVPKAGGPSQNLTGAAGLSVNTAGRMVIDGQNIYTLQGSSSSSARAWRFSGTGGPPWMLQEVMNVPPTSQRFLWGAASFGGRFFMLSYLGSAQQIQFWSANVNGSVLPAPPLLEQVFAHGAYTNCGGLALDDQYFYTTCRIGATGRYYGTLRVDRTTGALTEIGTHLGDAITGSVHASDTDADGIADYLYVQHDRRVHFVCHPSSPEPYTNVLTTLGSNSIANRAMGFDPIANTLWLWDETARELVRLD